MHIDFDLKRYGISVFKVKLALVYTPIVLVHRGIGVRDLLVLVNTIVGMVGYLDDALHLFHQSSVLVPLYVGGACCFLDYTQGAVQTDSFSGVDVDRCSGDRIQLWRCVKYQKT